MNTWFERLGCIALGLSFSIRAMAGVPAWDLNDVSILLALPEGGADAMPLHLSPNERSAQGELLPEAVYGLLPTLYQPGKGNASLYRDSLRVTAVRVDPCPANSVGACAAELRLVWQPVEFDVTQQRWVARDAAVHCVYGLSDRTLDTLLDGLWRLKREVATQGVDTRGASLGVHPASRDPRTAEAFAERLRALVLQHAGTANLRRVTFTALLVPTKWWRFGALQRDDEGTWRVLEIPRVDAPQVDVFNVAVADGVDLGAERGMDAIFNVLPDEYPAADNLFTVINKGFRFNDARDLPEFERKLDALARFRNPLRTHVDNLDCASCHFADAARFYVRNRFPELDARESVDTFRNPDPERFDLANATLATRSARTVRAFGFQGADPAISQRTINESAAAAHWLNRHMPGASGTSTGVLARAD